MRRATILAVAISLAICSRAPAQRWAYGEDEGPLLFAVGIVGDAVPVIDGNLAEWDSYPAWNTMTFRDSFIDNSFGTIKDLNSLDITVKLAWHAGTNMIYFAFDVFDDVHIQESAKGECLFWRQDDLGWYIDADNSGGSYNGNEPEGVRRCGPAQQLAILLGGVGDDICICSASKWAVDAPYMYWAGTVTETATGTQTTYEVGQMLFDFLDETPDASTIHNLFEGDVVGMSWDIDDQDIAGEQQTTAWYTTALTALYREADNLNDVEMAPAEWAIVQASFDLVVEGPNTDCAANPPFDCVTLTAGFALGATDGLDLQLGEIP